jgi:hypothetical protein
VCLECMHSVFRCVCIVSLECMCIVCLECMHREFQCVCIVSLDCMYSVFGVYV